MKVLSVMVIFGRGVSKKIQSVLHNGLSSFASYKK